MRRSESSRCFIPPYITDRLAESADPAVRRRALSDGRLGAAMRATRELSQAMPRLLAVMSPNKKKNRLVYDAGQSDQLPGVLLRAEGQNAHSDPAVNEAYDHSGDVYDFYRDVFRRNSLGDDGMSLVSSVHVAEAGGIALNNAFWNGKQMAYGDGDGVVFQRFTRALDVVGHEMTHGVLAFASKLLYAGQSGALLEHFCDVFGVLVRQWRSGEKAAKASWLVGADLLVPAATRRGVRDMENPGTAFTDDPYLMTDPQPNHLSRISTDPADREGVHVNSGIPNRAFVLTAKALKGNAWEVAGRIWYDTLSRLSERSQFLDFAKLTLEVATKRGAAAQKAVRTAWQKVGITL
jgi:Zn-dependent metalloprotease